MSCRVRFASVAVAVACAGALIVLFVGHTPPEPERRHRLAALEQTFLAVEGGAPLRVPALVDANGAVFAPGRLRGQWSLIFFGFTACPDVCPTTLQALSAVARDPGSGVSSGATQIVFVSLDPDRDTPPRVKSYLAHFGGHILGLTGRRDAVDRFKTEVGAGSRPVGSGIDHSTSLFVLDPHGRLAGILLRPADPARIVADLTTLRTSAVDAKRVSLAR